MAELKDHQQQETEGRLQVHSGLMLLAHAFEPLKVHNLKAPMWGTYCNQDKTLSEGLPTESNFSFLLKTQDLARAKEALCARSALGCLVTSSTGLLVE